MTEYWKSQARKYCDFCKCWLADNKVSVSFHENGKRHKESLQRHISQLSKKSSKEHKQKEKIDDEMKKMEKAAMSAYLKDIQNNADLTSQNINEMLSAGVSGSSVSPVANVSDSSVSPVQVKAKVKAPPVWQELRGEDGNSYYWNTETNETSWDPPDEFLSLAQQEEQKLKVKESEKAKNRLKKQKQKEAIEELKAHLARENMKELAVKKEDNVPSAVSYGPVERPSDPYGSWKTVVNVADKKIDLQLPKVEIVAPPVVITPETIRFKEKKVGSLGEGHVDFKKRKLHSNFKRNMRQKTEEE